MTRRRIDTLLTERGLAGSRTSAARSVRAGHVRIGSDGPIALKPGRVQGTNTLATRELGEPAVAEGGGGSVWYRYRTNTRQRVTLDTSNSSFDTVLGVFTVLCSSSCQPVGPYASVRS